MPVRRMDTKRVSSQALFRDVNERIRDLNEAFAEQRDLEPTYLCECPDLGCTQSITLPIEAYRRIRAEPTWFFVAADHVDTGLEEVVEDHGAYVVVSVPERLLHDGRSAVTSDA